MAVQIRSLFGRRWLHICVLLSLTSISIFIFFSSLYHQWVRSSFESQFLSPSIIAVTATCDTSVQSLQFQTQKSPYLQALRRHNMECHLCCMHKGSVRTAFKSCAELIFFSRFTCLLIDLPRNILHCCAHDLS